MNFIQQYGKNRHRCQQNTHYYAVWQLLLYFYREFPSKILSVYAVTECKIVIFSIIEIRHSATLHSITLAKDPPDLMLIKMWGRRIPALSVRGESIRAWEVSGRLKRSLTLQPTLVSF